VGCPRRVNKFAMFAFCGVSKQWAGVGSGEQRKYKGKHSLALVCCKVRSVENVLIALSQGPKTVYIQSTICVRGCSI
jgi:hypothetical protein